MRDWPDHEPEDRQLVPWRSRSKYASEDFNTLEPRASVGRVKKLWPEVGVCFVGGPSMTYKTLWALDACGRICRGRPVLGRKSTPCGVIYVGAEDPDGVRLRVKALRKETGPVPDGSFHFWGDTPDFRDPGDVDALRDRLREVKAEMAALGIGLGVLVIDTMSAAIPGADENTAKDMSPVLTAFQALAQEFRLLVLVVAHTGKNLDAGLRGWSGILANADGLVMFSIPDEGEPVRTCSVVKVKNGPAGDKHAFRLRVISLGTDDDGDEITSGVLDEEEIPDVRTPLTRITGGALIAKDALGYMLDHGLTLPAPSFPGIKPGSVAVSVEAWKTRSGEIGLWDQEDTPSNRRQKWHAAKVKLRDAGLVRIEGDFAIPLGALGGVR